MKSNIIKNCPYCNKDYHKENGYKGYCSKKCYSVGRMRILTPQVVSMLMEFYDVNKISNMLKLHMTDVIRIAKRHKLMYFEKQSGNSYLTNEAGEPVARDQFEIVRLMIERKLICTSNKHKLDSERKEWVKTDDRIMMALDQTMVPCRQCRDDVWWACGEYGLTCSLFENWTTTSVVRQSQIKRHNERVQGL